MFPGVCVRADLICNRKEFKFNVLVRSLFSSCKQRGWFPKIITSVQVFFYMLMKNVDENLFCYICIYEWFDWTFKKYFLYAYEHKVTVVVIPDNLSCDPFRALKSANALEAISCWYLVQKVSSTSDVHKSYLIVCRRWSHQSTRRRIADLFASILTAKSQLLVLTFPYRVTTFDWSVWNSKIKTGSVVSDLQATQKPLWISLCSAEQSEHFSQVFLASTGVSSVSIAAKKTTKPCYLSILSV